MPPTVTLPRPASHSTPETRFKPSMPAILQIRRNKMTRNSWLEPQPREVFKHSPGEQCPGGCCPGPGEPCSCRTRWAARVAAPMPGHPHAPQVPPGNAIPNLVLCHVMNCTHPFLLWEIYAWVPAMFSWDREQGLLAQRGCPRLGRLPSPAGHWKLLAGPMAAHEKDVKLRGMRVEGHCTTPWWLHMQKKPRMLVGTLVRAEPPPWAVTKGNRRHRNSLRTPARPQQALHL